MHWFHRSPQRSGKAVQKLHNVTPQQTGFPPASPMHATRREHARWSGNVKHNCCSLCQWQLLSRFRKSFVVAFGGSPSLCMASFGLQSIVRGCVVFLHGSGTPSPSSPPLLFLTLPSTRRQWRWVSQLDRTSFSQCVTCILDFIIRHPKCSHLPLEAVAALSFCWCCRGLPLGPNPAVR